MSTGTDSLGIREIKKVSRQLVKDRLKSVSESAMAEESKLADLAQDVQDAPMHACISTCTVRSYMAGTTHMRQAALCVQIRHTCGSMVSASN